MYEDKDLFTARRRFLLATAASFLSGLTLPAIAGPTSTDLRRNTLRVYVDILLPDDGLTPSASATAVVEGIEELAAAQPMLDQLISVVTDWLDRQGPFAFAELPLAEASAIVDAMAASDPDYLDGRFYQLIRLLAIELHYDNPATLAGLDLKPTPQPEGYPPPWS